MTTINEWLQFAPSPPELKPGQNWHVFLSYRSVHRPWVIQLYDVLRGLKFKVFLDQYVLKASDQLIGSLEEGLYKSASGVLIWSVATEDSKWCKKEYYSMESRSEKDEDFHYVTAVLDNVELDGFVSEKIYVDFSDCRSGPRGSGLLRLLYGITGGPLPEEAIKLATAVDENTRQAEAAIASALDVGNTKQLLKLAASQEIHWLSSPMLGSQVAEALTKLEQYESAIAVLADIEERYPKAIRPKQLKGLALARMGKLADAQTVLGELVHAGEQDPETLGLFARTWADRYKQSDSLLHLKRSRDLYGQAFENAPKDYYTGINAASKSVLLDELDEAEKYASRVEKIVGTEKAPGDYWMTATVAEVQLIRKNYDEASKLYKDAVAIAPEETGSHKSTWQQAQLLMDKLGTADNDRAEIAKAFSHL